MTNLQSAVAKPDVLGHMAYKMANENGDEELRKGDCHIDIRILVVIGSKVSAAADLTIERDGQCSQVTSRLCPLIHSRHRRPPRLTDCFYGRGSGSGAMREMPFGEWNL
jgi:hypothetical protein